MDGVDRRPHENGEEIRQGTQRRLVGRVDQVSVGDEDDVFFRELLGGDERLVRLDHRGRLVGGVDLHQPLELLEAVLRAVLSIEVYELPYDGLSLLT